MLFRKDPCGIICVLLTYLMLLHCLYVVLFVLIIPLLNESLFGTLNALIICTLIFLSILSHARAAYSDPGFVSLPKKGLDFSDVNTNASTNNLLKPNEEGWTVCNRCDTYRPARSHHCRLDHHCPFLCIESCLFGIFVITVFVDQIQSIINDRSLIDALKLDESSRTSQRTLPPKRVLFQNIFGSGPMILWLFPCDLKSSNKITDSQDTYNV
ncbi:unnamed protein product [Rotaria sp. Silwood2]|nr:unnamed protein product [Rotaria sp. Silwood2]